MPPDPLGDPRSSSVPAAPLRLLRWLASAEGRGAMAEAEVDSDGAPAISPTAIARWRKRWGAERAAAIASQLSLQRSAGEKLGDANRGHGHWLATPRALQQATDHYVARWKASLLPTSLLCFDLCSGVGGDAIALGRRGAVVAIDRDPAMCLMAGANLETAGARGAVLCAAAESLQLPRGVWLHADPDRRPGERRVSAPEVSEPPLEVLDRWIERAEGAAIKLAPAAALPAAWQTRCGRHWVSRGGHCRQQIAWFAGPVAPGQLRATRLRIQPAGRSPAGASPSSLESEAIQESSFECSAAELRPADLEEAPAPGRWIVDFDPAVRAAGLTAALARTLELRSLGGPAGFLTGDAAAASGLAASFELLWCGALDLKAIRREMRQREIGVGEVKIRGVDRAPEPILRKLRSAAHQPRVTLLIGRRRSVYAVLAHRRTHFAPSR